MAIKFTNTPERPPVEQKSGKVKAFKKEERPEDDATKKAREGLEKKDKE